MKRNKMRKYHLNSSIQRLSIIYLKSIVQYVLFGVIFIMYVVFIPWPPIKWVLFTVYILVPIFSAVGYCYFMNRSSFHFDSQNMVSKVSVYRLIVRLLSVLCFLLIGYYVNTNRVLQMFIFDSLSRFGEHGDNFA